MLARTQEQDYCRSTEYRGAPGGLATRATLKEELSAYRKSPLAACLGDGLVPPCRHSVAVIRRLLGVPCCGCLNGAISAWYIVPAVPLGALARPPHPRLVS